MAKNDNATFALSGGAFYWAVVGTAAPADLGTLAVAWKEIGHTSLDNVLNMSSEGGDSTVLGTLQAPTLRTSTAARTDSWAFNLQQWDSESLKYYFGSNAVLDTTGATDWLHVPDSPEPTTVAFLIVLTDGSRKLGFHCQKAEIKRGDDLDFADTASLSSLPLSVTPLNNSGAPAKYSVTPIIGVA